MGKSRRVENYNGHGDPDVWRTLEDYKDQIDVG